MADVLTTDRTTKRTFKVTLRDKHQDIAYEIDSTTPVVALRRALLELAHDGLTVEGDQLEVTVKPVRDPHNDPSRPWWRPW